MKKEEKAKSYVEIQKYKEATKRRGLSRCGTSQTNGCIFCGAQTVWFSNGVRIPDSRRKHAAHLVESYPEDLEPAFVDAFVQFTDILVSDNNKTVSQMSELLKKDGGVMLTTFLNVATALRIHLTLPINNCEGERSLSALTRVTTEEPYLGHHRPGAISIESDVVRELD